METEKLLKGWVVVRKLEKLEGYEIALIPHYPRSMPGIFPTEEIAKERAGYFFSKEKFEKDGWEFKEAVLSVYNGIQRPHPVYFVT